MMTAPKNPSAMCSIQMPRVPTSKDLGRFVSRRGPRADGTFRVLFEIPPRLRPSGWLPTTPLPIEGDRRGDLTDQDEVQRIKRDAAELYRRYLATRKDTAPKVAEKSFAVLIDAWQDSDRYRATKPRTQKGYAYLAREIEALVETATPKPDPVTINRHDVSVMLRAFDDRPTQKWHVRKVLRMVMDQAVARGWRLDNPVIGVSLKMPATKVTIWEKADVDAYVWAAVQGGQPWVAAMILTEWEIGQRLTDCVLLTRSTRPDTAGYDARNGVFRIYQSKTSDGTDMGYVTIRVSRHLRDVLESVIVQGSPYLFHDGATGRPFPDVDRLSHVFEDVRDRVVRAGGRRLVLRALRHSCVVQLARAGCELPEIAAITGHTVQTVGKMMSVYLPRDSKVAENAQRKRGLIEA